jgi:hypothetical protein
MRTGMHSFNMQGFGGSRLVCNFNRIYHFITTTREMLSAFTIASASGLRIIAVTTSIEAVSRTIDSTRHWLMRTVCQYFDSHKRPSYTINGS